MSKQLVVQFSMLVSLFQTLLNTKERTGIPLENVHQTLLNTRERTGTYRKICEQKTTNCLDEPIYIYIYIYISIYTLDCPGFS